MKKYAVTTNSGATFVEAKSKKEAVAKLQQKIATVTAKDVYRWN